IRAGDGVPESELDRVPNGDRADVLAVPAGAPRGLYNTPSGVAPRKGFARSPPENGKTTIRRGGGARFLFPPAKTTFCLLLTCRLFRRVPSLRMAIWQTPAAVRRRRSLRSTPSTRSIRTSRFHTR